jgi:hypothetical protein
MVEELTSQIEQQASELEPVNIEDRMVLLNLVEAFVLDNPETDLLKGHQISSIIYEYCGEKNPKGDLRKRLKPVIEEIFDRIKGKNG